VIDTRFAKGARHDFSLYKHSKVKLPKAVACLADSGYQGIGELHAKAQTPIKKPKGGELTDEQKVYNKALASERVVVEHIIRHLKIFRILSERYRNRRRRFMLRVNLIAGLYNYAIKH
jgi:IS5 family transposase